MKDISNFMRGTVKRVYIAENKSGCPAFLDWCRKLNKKEKLPQGKFFRKYEKFQQFDSLNTDNKKIVSINFD
ncbi:hypothetical protein M2713_004434 [Salmonella enterica]|uniref:hypothetical protein n=1 Tax=Escherichia coli TaxID=562 RepID=UPI000750DE9D|nr:hypothetical protein [Escherichia coli]EAQ3176359.1 hypothetical protein [Salmonella enterica]EBF1818563.1 hypothetical protein [Salmonella enterica]ECE1437558.1 hypothetical protein [Salmonella enterica]ECV6573905.1 hypothetical protein [Salmonella enterica]EII6362079.1 hypothetical protein [Escherichia coli]